MQLTFVTNEAKAIDTWALVVGKQPMSHFDLAKVLYIADKQHFNDYGRSIYGENYLATPQGPIPITLKNFIDNDFAFSPALASHKNMFTISNQLMQTHIQPNMEQFSKSDIQALESAIDKIVVKKHSHKLEILDHAWYKTPMHSLIDWMLIFEGKMSEEQFEDLYFSSRHSAH
jgi:hypothetical protein